MGRSRQRWFERVAGGLQLAVMGNVSSTKAIRDVSAPAAKSQLKVATALTAEQLRRVLADVSASERYRDNDLVDPIIVLAATGLRESELVGVRWIDFDADAATVTVTGKLVRATDHGLTRIDDTKSAAGKRTLPLPRFAVDTLTARRHLPFLGEQSMIFPSTTGTWRDPNNFNKRWRQVGDGVGGRSHTAVADLLDRTINDEETSTRSNGREKHPLKWGGRGSNPRPTDFRSALLEHPGRISLNPAAQHF